MFYLAMLYLAEIAKVVLADKASRGFPHAVEIESAAREVVLVAAQRERKKIVKRE